MNTYYINKCIGAFAGASNVENPWIEIVLAETHNECLQHEFKENEVIVCTRIVERVEWKWQEEHEHKERNVGCLAVVLTMICVLICSC